MSDEKKTPSEDGKKTPDEGDKKRRFKAGKGGALEVKEQRGLNRIPQWLTEDKGLPDWLAGSVVVVACGLLLSLLVLILSAVWPA